MIKRVVLSGASGGIGGALVSALLERGYELLCIKRPSTQGLGVVSAQGAACHELSLDLSAHDLKEQLSAQLDQLGWGELFALVNLAAVSTGAAISELSLEDWERSLQVNVTAPMLLTQLCAPRMTGEGGGVIVNVSSPVAHVGAKKASYAASKAALHGLTMSCAKTLGPSNIRVNTLLPGPTITKMTEDWPAERRASIAQESFLGRLSEPEEVAGMICCMLSDEARYMTGAIVDLTAGSIWGG